MVQLLLAMVLEVLPAVMATKRWGGQVIVQVERIVKAGSLSPKEVVIPGVLVDAGTHQTLSF